MLSTIIKSIESFIISNVSWTVFLGCILEQTVVPIPASLIVLSSTFIILKGTSFSIDTLGTLIIKIVIPASLGITLGSLIYYILAYKLGKLFIKRTSKYLGISLEHIDNIEKHVKESRYDDIFIFLARCFPVIPSIVVNLLRFNQIRTEKIHYHNILRVCSANIWLGTTGMVLWEHLPGFRG